MKPSIIKGKLLPQSFEDFMILADTNRLTFTKCKLCGEPFHKTETKSDSGWMETQISGSCEPCYDDLCAEIDEEDSDV